MIRRMSMARRALMCNCKTEIVADDDEKLYWKVQEHLDKEHSDLNLSADEIREIIRTKAYDK